MKKLFAGLTVLLLTFWPANYSYSQDVADSTASSVIYFYRLPGFAGSSLKMTISIDEIPVVRLRNASYSIIETTPGEHELSAGFAKQARLLIRTEPGKAYYIRSYYNMGFWSGIPILEMVDPNAGSAIISGRSLMEQPRELISQKYPTKELGIRFGGGIGFEDFGVFVDENGDDVTLSTGGGVSAGVEFNHDLGRSFNLSWQAFWQGTTLNPPLKNASASFSKLSLTLTPSVIIPVKGGEQFRFLLGAGPGIYTSTVMKIDASKISGDKVIMKYNSPVALHISLTFDARISEKGAMTIGMKYYNIKYDFREEGSTHAPSAKETQQPDGSGIDFTLGYYFKY